MVEKVYTTQLVREIERRVKKYPIDPLLGEFFQYYKLVSHRIDAVLSKYSKGGKLGEDATGLKFKALLKSEAIEAMIHDGIWSEKLAKIHGIEKQDVVNHNSKKIHIRLMIEKDFKQEFRDHLVTKSIKAFGIEKIKADTYSQGVKDGLHGESDSKGLLRKLLAGAKYKRENHMPRMLIEEKLYAKEGGYLTELATLIMQLNRLSEKRKGYDEIVVEKGISKKVTKKLSGSRWAKESKTLKDKIKRIKIEKGYLHSILLIDSESNRNFALIRAVGKSKLAGKTKIPQLVTLHVSSIWQGKILLDEYRKWFNEHYKDAIAKDKEISDLDKDKKRKARSRVGARIKKQERNQLIIDLLDTGETNSAEIARQTGIPVRTVRDIIKNHLYEKLNGKPDLTKEAQEQQLKEQEEEKHLREVLLVNEVKKVERAQTKQRLERLKTLLLEKHSEGMSPTEISKLVTWSALKINNYFKRNGIKPNFDKKFATQQEIEEQHAQKIQNFKDESKDRPKIEL